MRYQGGKSKISREISTLISRARERERERERERVFVSLFCGTCSIESKVKGFDKIICNDNHEYLIALLNGVQNGYELPEYISEDEYKYIRNHKDDDKVLTGFAGIACSFGGKWFAGYARNNSGRNYASEGKRSLLKDMKNLTDVTFTCQDYRDVELPEDCVVYADPPYEGTTSYRGEKFNSSEFWDYMREISKSHIVFISEQSAPNDFIAIWEKPFTRTLDVNKQNMFKVTEKLFVHKDSAYLNRN